MERVVVTGTGAISPLGCCVDDMWNALCKGTPAIDTIPSWWRNYFSPKSSFWAPLPPLDPSAAGVSRVESMKLDRTAVLGIMAAVEALRQANIEIVLQDKRKKTHTLQGIDPHRAGVCMGTGVGGACSLVESQAHHITTPVHEQLASMDEEARTHTESLLQAPARFNPFVVSMIMPNAIAAQLGIRFGLKGKNSTNSTACASGTFALGSAFQAIQRGEMDFALAGGVEFLGDPYGGIFRGFDTAGTLTDIPQKERANRPFDSDRRGFLFSEGGCGMLVLESLSHAEKRGAPILCEISGFSHSYDAHNIMMIDKEGTEITRMLTDLLAMSNRSPQDITYINAHGTGTHLNDAVEARVISQLFGRNAAVNSTKSYMGHTIGAAGALEAIVTVLSIRHATIHASHNAESVSDDIDIVQKCRHIPVDHAISQSFAFGGNNGALLFSRR
ncbi:beta-ketoacyl-[acyl-carrier-protein] synthase family protein [Chitinivibrio alkaliphilus]|uniref:3-oxoacyl-[acyl-carrier-protein] synthase II n=1 Tax=Chitinivibrio alkaliphilus ACht1 TaxID=1313304 RepID=U7D9W9_9BACT|nr:beta-ketoacyl-[acyl-carrier-protein] synthase family protein [Chitinivibrio alkaliphilus]ERP38782.1 3-oxoacyl-[acyl-carrier-protein] synthase II [Chitinivibrio alkaliphilus ACht1]